MKNMFLATRYLLLLVVVALLSGCGVKTLYGQLDWLILGMAEDYIQLTDEQDIDVKKRIDKFIDWHRKTQLPVYSQDLLQLKHDKQAGLSYDKLQSFFQKLIKHWETIKQKIAPEIADVLLTLDEKQRRYLFSAIKEKNDELIEKYVDISQQERDENVGERLAENLERWFGDMSDEQHASIMQSAKKFEAIAQDRLEFRRAWQKELRLVLNSKMSREEKHAELVRLFSQPETYQSTVYREKLAHNTEQLLRLILALPLTKAQNEHFYSQIDYYVMSFSELSAEARQ